MQNFILLLLFPIFCYAQSYDFKKLSTVESKLYCDKHKNCNQDCVVDFFQNALLYLNKNFNSSQKVYNWLFVEYNPNNGLTTVRCENKKIELYLQKVLDYNTPYFNNGLSTKTKIMSFYSKTYSKNSKVFNNNEDLNYVLIN